MAVEARSSAPDVDASREDAYRRDLDAVLHGALRACGFAYASVSLRRTTLELEIVALAIHPEGPLDDELRRAAHELVVGSFWPIEQWTSAIRSGERWGSVYLARQQQFDSATARGFFDGYEPIEDGVAWDVEDYFYLDVVDDDGRVRAIVTLGFPVDGRRPDPARGPRIEASLQQVGAAAIAITERYELERQVRLAREARAIVRSASAFQRPDEIIASCHEAVMRAFGARHLWIRSAELDPPGAILHGRADHGPVPDDVVTLADELAPAYWRAQAFGIASARRQATGPVEPEVAERMVTWLAGRGLGSALFVPLGVGAECLGCIVLTRVAGDPEWSDVEIEGAMDLGHDLGRVLVTARLFGAERRLADYKQQLMATVAHELKNPLSVVAGHLELIEASVTDDAGAESLAVIERAVGRLGALSDELLALYRLAEQAPAPTTSRVDLAAVVGGVLDLVQVIAASHDVQLDRRLPVGAVTVVGSHHELDRLVTNLVGNAIKYTPGGGCVRVRLFQSRDQVELAVSDSGIGIAEADQPRLFEEFFRSEDVDVRRRPGVGLGLAIAARIVERHAGTIGVVSALGRGSTFRVRLPVARD